MKINIDFKPQDILVFTTNNGEIYQDSVVDVEYHGKVMDFIVCNKSTHTYLKEEHIFNNDCFYVKYDLTEVWRKTSTNTMKRVWYKHGK